MNQKFWFFVKQILVRIFRKSCKRNIWLKCAPMEYSIHTVREWDQCLGLSPKQRYIWAHVISNVGKAAYSFVWYLIGMASQLWKNEKAKKSFNTKNGCLKNYLSEMCLDSSYSTNVPCLENKFSCGKKAKGNFECSKMLMWICWKINRF